MTFNLLVGTMTYLHSIETKLAQLIFVRDLSPFLIKRRFNAKAKIPFDHFFENEKVRGMH